VSASAKVVIAQSDIEGAVPPAKGAPVAAKTATVTPIQAANSAITENPSDSDELTESQNNLIRRTVDEIYDLMAEVHEIREELLAHGIHFHMLNALIEVGAQDKKEELKEMTASALEASVKAFGPQAIQKDELTKHLEEIIDLEKDLRHVRHVAKQQGVHMQALNHLTQLMRLNPGDKGVQAINTFVAYADAAGVPLHRMDAIRKQFKDGPKSVLPDIPRELPTDNRDVLKQIGTNILLGLGLTGIMMWFVL
jgi:ribosomal 50S subunit-associated protein YjgA (DUF615 family)